MSQADSLANNLTKEAIELIASNQHTLETLINKLNQHLKNNQDSKLSYVHKQTNLISNQYTMLTTLLNNNLKSVGPTIHTISTMELLQKQEEDRAKIAKDLEDSTAQLLANTIFELAAVKQLITKEDIANEITDGINALQQELEQGLSDLRLLIADLEPNTILGNFGLIAGLRRYLEKMKKENNLETELHVETVIEPLPNTIETAIFRIIQEALHNVRQHASATKVKVIIAEENTNLQFSVLDNGIGIMPTLPPHNQRRLGLVGMQEIAHLLQGTLDIKSEKDKGTQVILTIPYPKF